MFDVLRGVAMLGIFAVNLWLFAMPPATYMNPSAYGSLEGMNGLAWLVVHVFFDTKFITLFSLLFGAGIVVMTERADAVGRSSWVRHLRRTAALFLIGMIHAYGFWWGDILVSYAVCGLVIFWMRRWGPIKQLIIGLVLFSIAPLLAYQGYAHWAVHLEGDALQEQIDHWAPPPAYVEEQVAKMQGSWVKQMELRVPEALSMQLGVFPYYYFWRIAGVMMIGMTLYKWGMLTGAWTSRRYQISAAICLPSGLLLTGVGAWFNATQGWPWAQSLFLYINFNYVGSLLMAIGYVGIAGWLVSVDVWSATRSRLAAVGRLALTCYLGQTLLATTLFFGHGFGLYGEVSRLGQFVIFLLVSALQLYLAPLWLHRFRQGPLEWLLRGVVYLKFPPLRRETQPDSK